jgi:hypothetical protein
MVDVPGTGLAPRPIYVNPQQITPVAVLHHPFLPFLNAAKIYASIPYTS